MYRTFPRHVSVFEHDGEWTRALRRYINPQIAVAELPLSELSQCADRTMSTVSVAVVQGQTDAQTALAWAQACPLSMSVGLRLAIVPPSEQELAWLLREMGMAMVADEYWQAPQIAKLIERFWRQNPLPDLSLEQRIWNNLPWQPGESRIGRSSDAR
jgi:hypothetical protein